MPSFLKRIIHHTYRPWAIQYIRKDRTYRYDGLKIEVPTGVFHPGLFFSTKLLAKCIQSMDLSGKSLLELGCGTGMISCVAARNGADVTASDINPKAVRTAEGNGASNGIDLRVVVSDLFHEIPKQVFDVIVINPPYYPRKPKNMQEQAWFAGEDHEYFRRLFLQIGHYLGPDSTVLFSMSEDVDVESIQKIAIGHGFQFFERLKKWTIWEWNYVYQLRISV